MKKNLFQEKYIIWQTRNGSIEVLMISVCGIIFLVVPVFMFFINALFSYAVVGYARDCLEISSINCYTMIDSNSLGSGIAAIDIHESEKHFLENFKKLSENHMYFNDDAAVRITLSNGVIKIVSEVSVTGLDKRLIKVRSDTEFVIDPLLGGEK